MVLNPGFSPPTTSNHSATLPAPPPLAHIVPFPTPTYTQRPWEQFFTSIPFTTTGIKSNFLTMVRKALGDPQHHIHPTSQAQLILLCPPYFCFVLTEFLAHFKLLMASDSCLGHSLWNGLPPLSSHLALSHPSSFSPNVTSLERFNLTLLPHFFLLSTKHYREFLFPCLPSVYPTKTYNLWGQGPLRHCFTHSY